MDLRPGCIESFVCVLRGAPGRAGQQGRRLAPNRKGLSTRCHRLLTRAARIMRGSRDIRCGALGRLELLLLRRSFPLFSDAREHVDGEPAAATRSGFQQQPELRRRGSWEQHPALWAGRLDNAHSGGEIEGFAPARIDRKSAQLVRLRVGGQLHRLLASVGFDTCFLEERTRVVDGSAEAETVEAGGQRRVGDRKHQADDGDDDEKLDEGNPGGR
jgi:hypothetical protein